MDTAQLPVVCSKAAGFDYKDTKNKETLQAFSGRRVLFCTILYFLVLFGTFRYFSLVVWKVFCNFVSVMKHTVSHTKKTLSLSYFPDDDHRLGWRKLKMLLSKENRLKNLLASRRHVITPKELSLIFRMIGEPRE